MINKNQPFIMLDYVIVEHKTKGDDEVMVVPTPDPPPKKFKKYKKLVLFAAFSAYKMFGPNLKII